MKIPSIRLSSEDIESICLVFKSFFDKEDHLWIFGSRVDTQKKGGDIDLYIETHMLDAKEIIDRKLNFLTELYYKIGDQKIDVIINRISDSFSLPIYEMAKKEGVLLV